MTIKRPLRILHVLSQRPDSTGSGIYIQAMLREASKNGHTNYLVAGIQSDQEVQVDCIDDDQCRFVKFKNADIAYPIVGMSDIMPYDSTRFCSLSLDDLDQYEAAFSHHIKAAVDTFQPDIIHSHHLWIVTSLVRRLLPRIPLVTTCHGSDLRQFQNCPHLQQRVLDGCRGIDEVMALSHSQKRAIERLYDMVPDRVHVVGVGYNDSIFVQPVKASPGPVQLVYAGKLSRAKGVPWMLRALSSIEAPDWHLHLVGGGSGEEKAECLKLADRLGHRLTVHGAVSQQRLADIMKRSHVFVLPSFYEGLPLVVLEALASGCRIVATELPGITEILGDMRNDVIDLVTLPRLRDVDKPIKEDQNRFERDLKESLQRQMVAVENQPTIDLSGIAERMSAFSWAGIFKKVQSIYYLNFARIRP